MALRSPVSLTLSVDGSRVSESFRPKGPPGGRWCPNGNPESVRWSTTCLQTVPPRGGTGIIPVPPKRGRLEPLVPQRESRIRQVEHHLTSSRPAPGRDGNRSGPKGRLEAVGAPTDGSCVGQPASAYPGAQPARPALRSRTACPPLAEPAASALPVPRSPLARKQVSSVGESTLI